MRDLLPLIVEYTPYAVLALFGVGLIRAFKPEATPRPPAAPPPAATSGPVECPRCRGGGEMYVADAASGQLVQVGCTACGGAGQVLGYETFDYDDHRPCLECQGTGFVRQDGAVQACEAPECAGGWRVIRGALGYRNIRPLKAWAPDPDDVVPLPDSDAPEPIPDSSAPPAAAPPPDSSAPPPAGPPPLPDAVEATPA